MSMREALADPMSLADAKEYIPQWGSYIRNGDPGYIAYTRIPPEAPEHRDELVRYLRETCYPIALEGDDEESPDDDCFPYTDAEMIVRACAYLEGLKYPEGVQ